MKKTIITSAILLFTQIAIFAQTPAVTPPVQTPKTYEGKKGDNGNRPEKGQREKQPKMTAADRAVQYSNELKKGLTLSEDQYKKVLAVNTECITRKDAMKGSGDKATMKTGKADIKAYRLGEFQKIFTADQMTKYQSMNNDKGGKDDNNDGDGGKGDRSKGHKKDEGDKKDDN